MIFRFLLIASMAMACSASYAVGAIYDDFPNITFSGYGSIGAAHSSESNADFVSNQLRSRGAGYSASWSPDVDSRIAGQVSAAFTNELSATIQAVVERRYDDSYKPTLEWANIRYRFSPNVSIRAGRIALPILMAAEYRKVSYAVPWVRTPVEVYGLVPITNSDGIDASYRTQLGSLNNSLKVSFGKTNVRLGNAGELARGRRLIGISNVSEFGSAIMHAGYLQGAVDVGYLQPFFDAFRAFGGTGERIASEYEIKGKRVSVVSLGGTYDAGHWFATAEWVQAKTHSALADKTAWYASTGYRWGDFTPYVTYSHLRTDTAKHDRGVPTDGLAPGPAAAAVFLNTALNRYLSATPDQYTVSLGTRWELSKSPSLKVQYDHIKLGTESQGMLVNRQRGFSPGGKLHVVSAVVDFVF